MIPAITRDSIVTRADRDLDDYAAALDGLVLRGGAGIAPESYGKVPMRPEWQGDRPRNRHKIATRSPRDRDRPRHCARAVLSRVNAGTVYWNCCDRVSPRRPWSGHGDSGLGLTLSTYGIQTFTRPKAWHLRRP